MQALRGLRTLAMTAAAMLAASTASAATYTKIFAQNDPVPGAGIRAGIGSGAVFASFGVPAINASGVVAFRGTWKSSAGSGSAIFVGGVAVAVTGDVALLYSGQFATISTLKDPVIDDAGRVAFPGTVKGPTINAANNSVLMGNTLSVSITLAKAQEGTAAPGVAGSQWASFTSVAAPGGARGMMISGFMKQGFGGITALNDHGVWATDASGVLQLVLQTGTTVININGTNKTVRSFVVLTTVSGTPGQTHAFNDAAELVVRVTFTDSTTAEVHVGLP